MRDFFLTSVIPYWLLFIITTVSVGYSASIFFRSDENFRITRNAMLTVSGLLLLGALFEIFIYNMLGGNALWWVTGKEIGFWSKLLRVIPLIIFLLLQGAAPFVYKLFMTVYCNSNKLTVKPQFISLIVIVPVALIITRFFPRETRDLWFEIIAGSAIIITALYTGVKNISSGGLMAGLLYTIISFVLCAATLVTLLYLILAFISLILEILPVIACLIGVGIIFGKSYGNAVMGRDNDGNYIDSMGGKHSSSGARDYRNSQIRNQRNNS